MAQQDNGDSSAAAGSAVEKSLPPAASPGTAVVASDAFANPGLPPHNLRVTDLDPAKERQASRRVGGLFILSIVGSIFAIVAYIVFPIVPGDLVSVRLNTLFLGLGITLALIPLGIGAIYWAKNLMHSEEMVEQRHSTRGTESTRAAAANIFTLGNKESGFTRRKLIRNSLIGALAVFPLPAIVFFRDLAPAEDPVALFKTTLWKKGTRLALDPSGAPIKASDVTLGSVFHVIPEGLENAEHKLEEKAKAAVLLMKLDPSDLNELPERKDWSYNGIVAYSKICTHVGCPVALYEQHTHHLLCPCHQSTFDVTNHCEVIFGPAKRPLPQLPIAVDSEGYLIAQSDFTEPVGPSFWERSA
ncbi:menaquinol-cytochrome c reductase iron-sulfur subunit precursor [Homoserinimonas aerilata]|uniref:Cytochrome bc1 complex Rieske iron-sulfur subunit n=1 Tax=Homoserinimonas aerilata TaxID=1162970 RepID=A0A542YJ59_9MICO|nr:Rieske 2Fe-2S domain-containing protein [Homoserinimonas aerilata]TQL48128.1 menaquinol-cytochrome c reductase iron-sulfur subunit precursor [Homoserinimonas aerilata]